MQPPGPNSALAAWLDYQTRTHPKSIELGLERVGSVYQRLGAPRPGKKVIVVAGTNGKGSTVAFIESIALQHGVSVGCYTSPHLLRYEERLRVGGALLDAADWVAAFEVVSAARGDTPLTYFEWGTLAALWLLQRIAPDLAVLEVGLGGRLDAVNVVDADVAVITAVDLDHTALLGPDRESIGREKAGVLRARGKAVLAEPEPPASVVDAAQSLGCSVRALGLHYHMLRRPDGSWQWSDRHHTFELPTPGLASPCQWMNLAGAVQAFACLFPVDPAKLSTAVRAVRLPGRMQCIERTQTWMLDVAHNPHAIAPLRSWIEEHGGGRTLHAVFAALADKDVAGMLRPLIDHVAHWHLAGLVADGVRGRSAEELMQESGDLLQGRPVSLHRDVAAAVSSVHAAAGTGDLVLVFGSFYTVAAALQTLEGTAD